MLLMRQAGDVVLWGESGQQAIVLVLSFSRVVMRGSTYDVDEVNIIYLDVDDSSTWGEPVGARRLVRMNSTWHTLSRIKP